VCVMYATNRSAGVRGDFQTPTRLAAEVWSNLGNLADIGAVVEPTVGSGAFLASAPEHLLSRPWRCADIEPEHVHRARAVADRCGFKDARIECANAFDMPPELFADLDREQPLLAIGNPPWVTSSGQGASAVQNLPVKSNADFGLAGLDAMTGKANFDIAEAILLRLLSALADFRNVRIAFLVKRTVAMKLCRRLLGSASELSFARIDAAAHFDVSVDAGLFVARSGGATISDHVDVSETLDADPTRRAGFRNDRFVEDLDAHDEAAHLEAEDPVPWRQGIKHDVARILELIPTDDGLENGLGEVVDIEAEPLCPFYKGSDVANGREPRRLFPLFQVDLSGPRADLADRWPKLAGYLARHEDAFAARRSRIYEGKPRFSVFGVGSYTLAPWKVVVSGLYSTANFCVIGPSESGSPSLVDDTCYLLPYEDEGDAHRVAAHLNDLGPQGLLRSLMDQGAKRPITKALLSRIEVPVRPFENADTGRQKLPLVA
jgi:hypothetical protein